MAALFWLRTEPGGPALLLWVMAAYWRFDGRVPHAAAAQCFSCPHRRAGQRRRDERVESTSMVEAVDALDQGAELLRR